MSEYEELVKRLNEYSAQHENHGGITAEAADAIEELSETVNMQKAQIIAMAGEDKPHWISMDEALPNDCQSVLVLRKDGGIFLWEYRKDSSTDEVWVDDYGGVYSIYDSSHWMLLPQPPQEVNDGT